LNLCLADCIQALASFRLRRCRQWKLRLSSRASAEFKGVCVLLMSMPPLYKSWNYWVPLASIFSSSILRIISGRGFSVAGAPFPKLYAGCGWKFGVA
jgi:hypothetical protein